MLISDRKARLEVARGFLQAATGGNVLVTSCHPGEGKSTIAVNIASALAEEAGRDVLLVDANVEAPVLHERFNIPETPGLFDVIDGKVAGQGTVVNTSLRVLPIGSDHARPGGLVKSQRMEGLKEFLAAHRARSGFVVLDGSSIFGAVNSAPLASSCDGVVLVVESEKTRWEVVQSARDQLRDAGAEVLGVVLNRRRYYIPRSVYG